MTVSFADYQLKIDASQTVLVIYGERARLPAVAAATGLYLWLKKLGKKVALVSPRPPVVEYCHLIGINKVKTSLPQENLVITLPYKASKLDCVISDLNTQTNELSLIIKPQAGELPLAADDLKISHQIADFDLTILIDVRSGKELTKFSKITPNPWSQPEKVIALNSFAHPAPVKAAINESISKHSGFCTFLGTLWQQNQVAIETETASNLLIGLEEETDHFRSDVSADAFELAAWLIRCGGNRYRPDQEMLKNFSPANHLPSLPPLPPKKSSAPVDLPSMSLPALG